MRPHDLIAGDAAEALALDHFTVQQWTTSPTEVADQLERAWVPFWQRDPPEFQTDGAAWPGWLVTARTVFLLKDLLFRLWTKVWVSELLQRLDAVLPVSITGGLPGRSTTDVYWPLQLKIEQSLLDLDLTKCFNLLSRYLAGELFKLAGLPACVAHAWKAAMFRCVRVLQVCGHSSAPVPSTTGVVEGDPAGPLVMILVATVCLPPKTPPWMEVTTASFPAVVAAVEANRKFHVAMRNQINYSKSWCWATTKEGRASWHAFLLTLPVNCRFPVKNEGVYLGAQMSYTKRNAAISKNKRIDEAIRRANAIPTLPLCVADAAKTVRSAVLLVGLFGVEGNFLLAINSMNFDWPLLLLCLDLTLAKRGNTLVMRGLLAQPWLTSTWAPPLSVLSLS